MCAECMVQVGVYFSYMACLYCVKFLSQCWDSAGFHTCWYPLSFPLDSLFIEASPSPVVPLLCNPTISVVSSRNCVRAVGTMCEWWSIEVLVFTHWETSLSSVSSCHGIVLLQVHMQHCVVPWFHLFSPHSICAAWWELCVIGESGALYTLLCPR